MSNSNMPFFLKIISGFVFMLASGISGFLFKMETLGISGWFELGLCVMLFVSAMTLNDLSNEWRNI